jgi:Zn finger protein HypA/HybF involved in hydrogenase expression
MRCGNQRSEVRSRCRRAARGSLALALLLAACSRAPAPADAVAAGTPAGHRQIVLAAAPAMTVGVFPCSDCHDPGLPVRTAPHKLTTAHQEIELRHGSGRMWCFDCHDSKARDQLRTAAGQLIAFDDAQLLCGQCHGHQLRDWEAGAHGRRTGSFTDTATALRCVHCHGAHAPHFKPLPPMPAPQPPRRTS